MKSNWDTVNSGLDQLFFTPFVQDETPSDRAACIENYLKFNGWTWDEVLAKIAEE